MHEEQIHMTSPNMEQIDLAQPPHSIPRLTSTSKKSRKLRVNRRPNGFYPDESSSNSNSCSPEPVRTADRQSSSRHANLKRGNPALLPKTLYFNGKTS